MNCEDGSITVVAGSTSHIRFVTGVNCATEKSFFQVKN